MILDRLDNIDCYKEMHPLFPEIFKRLKETDWQAQQPGKMECGDYYINVEEVEKRGRSEARCEAHDRYIDIQVPITETEEVGYRSRQSCTEVLSASAERDIVFYEGEADQFFTLAPGSFAIFFPQDAHAPIVGEGRTKKLVVKVPVLSK